MVRIVPPTTSVMASTAGRLARAYAEALLGLLDDQTRAEQVWAELAGIVELLDRLADFRQLLTSASLSPSRRVELIRRVFGGRASKTVEGLLAVMARNGRMELLSGVAARYRQLLNHRENKVEVLARTAEPLGRSDRKRLTEVLREILPAEPLVKTVVDENLLGGLLLQIGDRVYDASVAGDLKRLSDELAGGSPRVGMERSGGQADEDQDDRTGPPE